MPGCGPCSGGVVVNPAGGLLPLCSIRPLLALLPGRGASLAALHPPAAGWQLPGGRCPCSAWPATPATAAGPLKIPGVLKTGPTWPGQGVLGPDDWPVLLLNWLAGLRPGRPADSPRARRGQGSRAGPGCADPGLLGRVDLSACGAGSQPARFTCQQTGLETFKQESGTLAAWTRRLRGLGTLSSETRQPVEASVYVTTGTSDPHGPERRGQRYGSPRLSLVSSGAAPRPGVRPTVPCLGTPNLVWK